MTIDFSDELITDDAKAARVAGVSLIALQDAERQGAGPMTRWTTDLKRWGRSQKAGAWSARPDFGRWAR